MQILKKPNTLILLLTVVGVAGWGIVFFLSYSNKPDDQIISPADPGNDKRLTIQGLHAGTAEVATSRQDVSDLQRQLQTLSGQVSNLVDEVAKIKRSQSKLNQTLSPRVESPDNLDSQSPQLNPEEISPEYLSTYEEVSEHFRSEDRNEIWATSSEDIIRQEFSAHQEISSLTVDDLECRSAICRLSFRYPDGLTPQEAAIMENEVIVALSKTGFNNVSSKSRPDGSIENLVWYYAPPDMPPPKK